MIKVTEKRLALFALILAAAVTISLCFTTVNAFSASKKIMPAKVSGIKASAKSNSIVKITWKKVKGATGYQIERKQGSKKWKRIAVIRKGSTKSFNDKSLKGNTKYSYRIRACKRVKNKTQYGGWSNTVAVKTKKNGYRVPAKVSGIKASAKNNYIVIKWKKVKGAAGYQIERKQGSNNWKRVAVIKKGSTLSYTDKSLKGDTYYRYRIRAYIKNNKNTQYGEWSKGVIVKTKKHYTFEIEDAWPGSPKSGKSIMFNKNASWVRFDTGAGGTPLINDGVSINAGVIDKKGTLLCWLIPDAFVYSDSVSFESQLTTTPFINGLSAAYTCDSISSYPGFAIINDKGEEVYYCKDLYMCGQAEDGKFLVASHETGFSENSWHLHILWNEDTDLNVDEDITNPNHDIEVVDSGKRYFIGGDFVDFEKKQYTKLGYFYKGIYEYNHEKYVHIDHWAGEYLIPIPLLSRLTNDSESLETLITDSSVIHLTRDFNKEDDDNYYLDSWKGLSYYHTTPFGRIGTPDQPVDYVDLKGNVLVQFPKIPDGALYQSVDSFSDGYAGLYLKGVDNENYFTIMDESGSMVYSPIKCPEGAEFDSAFSNKGYVFIPNKRNGINIYYPNGKKRVVGDDLTALAGMGSLKGWLNIGSEYMWVPDYDDPRFVSLDGKKCIRKVHLYID